MTDSTDTLAWKLTDDIIRFATDEGLAPDEFESLVRQSLELEGAAPDKHIRPMVRQYVMMLAWGEPSMPLTPRRLRENAARLMQAVTLRKPAEVGEPFNPENPY